MFELRPERPLPLFPPAEVAAYSNSVKPKGAGVPTAAALADLGLLNGKTDGGTAHYYVSDTPDNFAELEQMFLGEYAGGPVERIAIETY